MEKESVDINGEKIVFFVQRKNIKNINLKVNLDKKVTMSIPMKMEIEIAKEFVKNKADWIKKQQNYYESFAEEKENITFENGETVYLLGKQYKMKMNNFQEYIHQAAEQAINSIGEKKLIANTEKLTEYIGRGKPKYAKKMMRLGASRVLSMDAAEVLTKIKTLARWKDKFHIDEDTHQIVLKTYAEVEAFIDLFEERYTRSDITDTEYDTDVKTVAEPA